MFGLSFIYPVALWLLLVLAPIWALALLTPRRLTPGRFWTSLGLRTALIVALVLSLAGTQVVRAVDEITTVFLIDSSDSVSPSARGRAEAFVQEALDAMDEGDQAAIVVFGENALVERAPSSDTVLGRLASTPIAARTNIEEAIQLGLALFPSDTQKRLVLISDGGENTGNAREAARLAASRDIPIAIVNLEAVAGDDEVLVADLDAPGRARDGQEVTLVATVESSSAQPARLQVFADQDVIVDQTVQLNPGTNRFSFTAPAGGQGFRRYRVRVQPERDNRVQNNEVAALVQIEGPPRVLLIEGVAGEAAPLQNALQATNIEAEVIPPNAAPTDLAGLSSYAAVVLVNVPARALPVQTMAVLPVFVRDLGKGLLMIGGDESYGVGGYGNTPVEEAMPVYMDVRNREERPNLALVFVIDKSGSMDACHCSDPNRRSAQFQQGGERKIDIAKEAVTQASGLLTAQDTLGIVAFDDGASWVLPATRDVSTDQVASAVSNVEPRGNTNVRAGLQAAEEMLRESDARIKHVILLSDGWGHGGDNLDLAQRMRDQGMTVTVVAAGSGSADYLENLAGAGGGRYYPVQDMAEVPQIFLQETITAVGNYIIEEPFLPILAAGSPVLDGLEQGLPPLYGYNGSTIKETARNVLVTDDNSPVLAQWQYGLGRAIAWTSDTKAQWARDWVAWEQFPRFAAQLVGWVLPVNDSQGVTTDVETVGTQTIVNVGVTEEGAVPREDLELTATLIGGDGVPQTVELTQVAPGQYRGTTTSPPPGTYLVQIAGSADGRAAVQETAGLVVPYSPEYRQQQSDPALLAELAQLSGGSELAEPAAAFARDLSAVNRAQEIALPLLWLALLLLPLDIAFRRLLVRRSDLPALSRLFSRPAAPARPVERDANLDRLAEAKRRATRSSAMPPAPAAPPSADRAPRKPGNAVPPAPPPAPASDEDPLERLRAAKERARRRARGEE